MYNNQNKQLCMSYRLNFSNQSFHVHWLIAAALLWSGTGKLGTRDTAEWFTHNTTCQFGGGMWPECGHQSIIIMGTVQSCSAPVTVTEQQLVLVTF